jgi:sugar lactone lactonase YvrE
MGVLSIWMNGVSATPFSNTKGTRFSLSTTNPQRPTRAFRSESFVGRLTAFDIETDGGLSNRRVFAEGVAPDGICLDAEGAVWVTAGISSVARVAEGGEVLQRVELPREHRAPLALMLGGPDRRTLFILTAEWRAADSTDTNLQRITTGSRTGEILALPVTVAGTGRP